MGDDRAQEEDLSGNDRFFGGLGNDSFMDYVDNNRIFGGVGNDWMYGHYYLDGVPGDDRIQAAYYESTRDSRIIRGGTGEDWIRSSGLTNDTIYAKDGEHDDIACGRGKDTVYFDRGIDSVNPLSCENLIGE